QANTGWAACQSGPTRDRPGQSGPSCLTPLTRRIVWLKRVECYERIRESKGMLTKASAGEISGHERSKEMLMRVDCSYTHLGVAVLKLTAILITQICRFLEGTKVVCK
ncbi:hypothetical protein MKX03_025098, partial [Papaver bracteatum]